MTLSDLERALRLRGRGVRAPARRLRDRGCRDRRGARRRRPDPAQRDRPRSASDRRPIRAEAAEAAVAGKRITEIDAEELGRVAMADLESVPSDLNGSAAYRTRVGAAMVERARGAGAARRPSMPDVPMRITVNGRARAATVEPRKTLADFLREDCQLTGTHLGCEHGVCGACTVLVDGAAVRSCLMFAVQADGRRGHDDRRHRHTRRRADARAVGVPRLPRPAVRLLHAGLHRVDDRVPARQPGPDRRGDPDRAVGQPLPLHRLPGHRRRGAPGRRADRGADKGERS